MTRDQALEAIRASISLGTCTPIFQEDRAAAVRDLARALEAHVIEPAAATIVGVAHESAGLLELLAAEHPLVIARSGNNWLGYLSSSREFFLAYGPHTSQLNALGFHSQDVLAEWHG